jgi:hypothetical protein
MREDLGTDGKNTEEHALASTASLFPIGNFQSSQEGEGGEGVG